MGVSLCDRCSVCGSDLAEGPNCHQEPKPHKIRVEKVTAQTDAGEIEVGTLSRCVWCQDTLEIIKKCGEPFEHEEKN